MAEAEKAASSNSTMGEHEDEQIGTDDIAFVAPDSEGVVILILKEGTVVRFDASAGEVLNVQMLPSWKDIGRVR